MPICSLHSPLGSLRACLIALTLSAPTLASAQERPTLSGSWSASALTEQWVIGDWGEACGPKPAAAGAGGGSVQISEGGGELAFSGGGYPRTSGCFEMGGGISVVSHSASPRAWQTRCATSANDPRKATIITTVTATDSRISFDETGQYQFILKQQNCTASVRRSRSYSLVRRQGEEPPATTATSTAQAAPTAAATEAPTAAATPTTKAPVESEPPRCATPGDVARVELRPARALLKPGETLQLKASLFDANGCRVGQGPSWSTLENAVSVSVSATGLVSASAQASEGEYVVLAGVHGKAARAVVEVVSPERYAQLLTSGREAESDEAAVAIVATSSLGSAEVVGEDKSGQRRILFLGIVGVVVAALGAAGVVWLRRTRPEREVIEVMVPGETKMRVVKKKRIVATSANAPPMVCPTCKRGYAEGAAFCPVDGAPLTRAVAAPGAPQPSPPQASGALSKACPVCGGRYPASAAVCSRDGASLVAQ